MVTMVLQAPLEILLETLGALETMQETLMMHALENLQTAAAALVEMLTRKSKVQCGDVTGVAVAGGDVTGVATTHAHVSAPFLHAYRNKWGSGSYWPRAQGEPSVLFTVLTEHVDAVETCYGGIANWTNCSDTCSQDRYFLLSNNDSHVLICPPYINFSISNCSGGSTTRPDGCTEQTCFFRETPVGCKDPPCPLFNATVMLSVYNINMLAVDVGTFKEAYRSALVEARNSISEIKFVPIKFRNTM